ncbi:MAG: chemotaxis response regulator protein-glutamate methylesterase [Sphaerospermopsis sp. SIO1G2]|nr:chemotaxis response regulator protein-glutamate methylesterase [Sphaerospermopsis sp. SIO1G2]
MDEKKIIRVLVVDDSPLMQKMFSEMLGSDKQIEVVGVAADPYEAREKIKQLDPDVITLDVEMPKMDGISFLEKIMRLRPMPVVMLSTLTQRGAQTSIQALELGAFDVIGKPVHEQTPETLQRLKRRLITKVKAAAQSRVGQHVAAGMTPQSTLTFTPPNPNALPLIAIGASTGGVEALRIVIAALPANTPPIVITQHMPASFIQSFADRLNGVSNITVKQAVEGECITAGTAYISAGDKHLCVRASGGQLRCHYDDQPEVSGHKPSVDVLFQSVAAETAGFAVGVILTGMGKDGAMGMKQMHDAGIVNIGQNEESCVVYGMPRVAKELGAVQKELPLHKIAAGILHASAHLSGRTMT